MDSDSDEEFQKAIAASLQTENSKLICPQKQEEIDKSIAISLQANDKAVACALSEVEKEKLQSLDTDEALARALQEVEEENAFSGFTRYNKEKDLSNLPQYGIIILGNTGVGKSLLANIILGEDVFTHEMSATAVTTKTEYQEIEYEGGAYAIFNIPGLIEDNEDAINRNKQEIDNAFEERQKSIIVFVFQGGAGGRLKNEDVVAFKAMDKSYKFKNGSILFIVNDLPTSRPRDFEGQFITRIENILEFPNPSVCFLNRINKENHEERDQIRAQLFAAFQSIGLKPADHIKACEIELNNQKLMEEIEMSRKQQQAFEEVINALRQDIASRQRQFELYRNETERRMREMYENHQNQMQNLNQQVQNAHNQNRGGGRRCSIM